MTRFVYLARCGEYCKIGRGYGKVTRLVKEDVIREQERRSELLERRLKRMHRS